MKKIRRLAALLVLTLLAAGRPQYVADRLSARRRKLYF